VEQDDVDNKEASKVQDNIPQEVTDAAAALAHEIEQLKSLKVRTLLSENQYADLTQQYGELFLRM
jgi:hypothetical protein